MAFRSSLFRSIRSAALARRERFPAHRVVSVLLGLVLLSAALLKTHQLATEPMLGSSLLQTRWFLVGVIQFELLLSVWLFSGLFPCAAWCALLATFATFAVVAGRKVIAGDASCGCFGQLPTSPWLSLSIDVGAMVALWASRGRTNDSSANRYASAVGMTTLAHHGLRPVQTRPKRLPWLALAWLATALFLGTVGTRGVATGELPGIGKRLGDTIIVEPERMLGGSFALANYMDMGNRLVRGRWLVVLYREGCPDCRSVLARSGDIEAAAQGRGAIAYVSVPAHASETIGRQETFQIAGTSLAMKEEYDWLVSVPLFIVVEHNRVLAAGSSLDESLRSFNARSPRRATARESEASVQGGWDA